MPSRKKDAEREQRLRAKQRGGAPEADDAPGLVNPAERTVWEPGPAPEDIGQQTGTRGRGMRHRAEGPAGESAPAVGGSRKITGPERPIGKTGKKPRRPKMRGGQET